MMSSQFFVSQLNQRNITLCLLLLLVADYAALRLGGDLIFKLMSKLVR